MKSISPVQIVNKMKTYIMNVKLKYGNILQMSVLLILCVFVFETNIFSQTNVYSFYAPDGTNYCAGSTGKTLRLSGSQSDHTYQLWQYGMLKATKQGNGGPIDFENNTSGGGYSYTVQAVNSNGVRTLMSGSIVLTSRPVPTLSFSGDNSFCTGETNTWTVSGADSYAWSPSTDLTSSTGATVNCSLTASRTYTITGTTQYGCSSTLTKAANYNGVSVNINPSSATIPAGGSVSLTASGTGIQYYNWSPSTGLSETDKATVTASPTTTTTYTFTGNNQGGCSGQKTVTVTVQNSTVYTLTAPDGTDYCAGSTGKTLRLSGSQSDHTYELWQYGMLKATKQGNGGPIDFENNTSGGGYPYSVQAVNSNGVRTLMSGSIVLTSRPVPTLSFSGDNSFCTGETNTWTVSGADSYTWSPSTDLSSATGATVNCSLTASRTYTITGTTQYGCSSTLTKPANYNGVSVNINPSSATIPAGGSVSLTASGTGIQYYNWSPSTGLSETDKATVTASPTTTTTYTFTGNNQGGCSDQKTVTVTVQNSTVYTLTAPNGTEYCAGSTGKTLRLSGSQSDHTYELWQYGMLKATKQGNGGPIDFENNTSGGGYPYTVQAVNSNGVRTLMDGSIVLTSRPVPELSFSGDNSFCSGETNTWTVSGADNYTWSPSTDLSSATGATVNCSLTASRTYTITGTTQNGCSSTLTKAANYNGVSVNVEPSSPTIPAGGSVSLTASGTGIQYYNWSPSTGLSETDKATVTASPTTTTTYTFTGNNQGGCSDQTTVTVTVQGSTVYTLTAPNGTEYCDGSSGMTLRLSGSQSDHTYELWQYAILKETKQGNGGPIDFENKTSGGGYPYSVQAVNSNGVRTLMNGSVILSLRPNPEVKDLFIDGGSNQFCSYSPGVRFYLDDSQVGVKYILKFYENVEDEIEEGDGDAIKFPSYHKTVGNAYNYYAIGEYTSAPYCIAQMNNAYVLESVSCPNTPTNVLAAPTGTSNQVKISWNDQADNETGYIIMRSTNETTGFNHLATLDANQTSYYDNSAISGITYYYRIAAYNDYESEWVTTSGVSATSSFTRTEPDIISKYVFQEAGGNVIHDLVAGNHLVIDDLNYFEWNQDKGLKFHSSDGIKSKSGVESLLDQIKSSGEYSFEFWLDRTEYTSSETDVFVIENQTNGKLLGLQLSGCSKPTQQEYYTAIEKGNTSLCSDTYLRSHIHHVVVTRSVNSPTYWKLYVDGVLIDEAEPASNFNSWISNSILTIGKDWKGTLYFFGIYSQALSNAEVIQNYNAGLGFTVEVEKELHYQLPLENTTLRNTDLTEDNNYVYSVSPRKPYKTLPENPTYSDLSEQVTYFDGLGREVESAIINGSPQGDDIRSFKFYDDYGRESKQYLPFASGNDGHFIQQEIVRINAVKDFYQSNDKILAGREEYDGEHIYSETHFENSPLSRVVETGSPGAWNINSGHSVKYNYKANISGSINSYTVGSGLTDITLNGTYEEDQLYVTEVINENNQISLEYKDKAGKVILKESVLDENNVLKTYYVYDDIGLLRCVVPPEAKGVIDSNLCYFYSYDERKRMIEKKLPGAHVVEMTYDKRDRLRATRDGNQKVKGKWLITKYDNLNRPVLTLFYNSTATRGAIQTTINSAPLVDNEVLEEGNINDPDNFYGYTNQSWPNVTSTDQYELLSVSYYDKYYFNSGNTAYDESLIPENELFTNTTGLLTAIRTAVLAPMIDMPDMLLSVSYYDSYGRTIQTISENHLGGNDKISSQFSFNGELLYSLQHHIIYGGMPYDIHTWNDYDHAGRLLSVRQRVDIDGVAGEEELLVANEYNELGELVLKYTGGKKASNNTYSVLQKTDYTYNIRGWLNAINDPEELLVGPENDLFGMRLHYENVSGLQGIDASGQYNGNISAIVWNEGYNHVKKAYGFNYDNLNRIKKADFAIGDESGWTNSSTYDVNNISYDLNGNIVTLDRFGNSLNLMDQLAYKYQGNQLTKVDDAANEAGGFSDGTNIGNDYTYDANGNMITDENKGIVTPITYNYLNLPQTIAGSFGTTDYFYTSSGSKLRYVSSSGKITDYIGQFIYEKEPVEERKMTYILSGEGRLITNNTSVKYEYHLKDHLGNVRITFCDDNNDGEIVHSEISQVTDYYPFGMRHEPILGLSSNNKYLYNGKELQDETGWLDYGARMYDAALGRWHVMDGHAESYYDFSPYTYTFNNPINYIDLFGLDPVYRDGAYYDSETGKEMKWRKVERWLNKNDAVSERLTINDEEFKYENFETGESFSISKSNFTGNAAKLNNALVSGAKVENQYAAKEKAVKDAHKEGINLAKFVGFKYDPYAGVWKYDDGPEYVVDLNDFGIKNTDNFSEVQGGIRFYKSGSETSKFHHVQFTYMINMEGNNSLCGPAIALSPDGRRVVAAMIFPDTKSGKQTFNQYKTVMTSNVFQFYYNSYMRQFRSKGK